MKVGFIGLGNVGGKLAGSLLRNGHDVTIRDLDPKTGQAFLDKGAHWADSPKELAEAADMIITCLPSAAACSAVMESDDGVITGLSEGKIWLEMSTTDDSELRRIADLVLATGARALEAPVSGGCHRAATGNISIFVGGDRESFEQVLPVLTTLGRRVLHTDALGTASVLKVMTNYLEESVGVQVLGNGFPAELADEEQEEEGYEVVVSGRGQAIRTNDDSRLHSSRSTKHAGEGVDHSPASSSSAAGLANENIIYRWE